MLTAQQLSTLKAAILADPVLGPMWTATDDHVAVADAFNMLAVPDFIVWRTSVPVEEIMRNGMDWTRVDNLGVGKARIWDWMSRLGTINPSQSNIRTGIDTVWAGTAADLAVRAAVYVHCKRPSTRVEQLFATGTGSNAAPGTMTIEGALSPFDVQQAKGAA